jgi:DNA-binding response OmpR family regulator
LVTDIGLPGLNGRQVADAGRQLRPELRVLFMTGYAQNTLSDVEALAPGMELITKPFAIDAFSRRIKAMLDA